MFRLFIQELNKIKTDLSIIKPMFRLANLNTKIIKKKDELDSLKKEIETFKFEEELIDLKDIYVLKNKDKINFVFKKYVVLKDNVNVNDYQGIYKGYFIDIFNFETICHFKETVDYENDDFKIEIIDTKHTINYINDYISLNETANGKILRSTLKKLYLKLNKNC